MVPEVRLPLVGQLPIQQVSFHANLAELPKFHYIWLNLLAKNEYSVAFDYFIALCAKSCRWRLA